MTDSGFTADGALTDGNSDGSGSGSLKSASSMCANTHSIDTSVDALFVASAARLLPFSLKPIDMSALTIAMSGSTRAGAGVDEVSMAAPSWSSGSSTSPGCSPRARRCSSEIVFGTSTRTSSFFGVQSSPT